MDKYNIKFHNNIKKFLNVPMKLLFDIKLEGLDNIPDDNYILAGNHKSMFDIPLLITSIPDNIHFMAKKEIFSVIALNYIVKNMGAIPVNRDGVDIKVLKTSINLLKDGEVIGIFPEGTRNKTEDIILPFKGGVNMLSNRSNKLILPFGISGEYKFRGDILLNIGKPIDIKNIDKNEQNEYLEEKVKELILK